jgi:TrmH family RNA methyltransferase
MATTQTDTGRLRRIEGRHNALVKELRQAFDRGELTPAGECAVEGFRIIEEAVRSETPQGVAALVQVKKFSLPDILDHSASGSLLVIAGVQDPGNLGTILRSAEAFGAQGVILGDGTVSAYNSKVVRASAGSVFRLMVSKVALTEAIPQFRTRGIRMLATSSHKGTPLPQANLPRQVAIFIGNEGAGLDKRLLSQMDELITIPHSPRVESLNAGVAASVVLYEFSRRQ